MGLKPTLAPEEKRKQSTMSDTPNDKPEDFVPFKEKEVKVYASNEWLANNQRKYRAVFETNETTYIWCEFSFYNKLFDEEDWKFDCQLKAFGEGNREIASVDVSRDIKKDQNIIYVREGWGMDKPGAFWKKGTYRWEIWLDGKLFKSTTFYIVDNGEVTDQSNPYLHISGVRLYEGPYNDTPQNQRKYYSEFDRNNTRYIWTEFRANNNLKDSDGWPCELFFNYYSDTGQLKGTIRELVHVKKDQEVISANVGWGSDKVGTWFHDDYKVEIVFMDRVIAVIPFTVSDTFVEAEGTQHRLPDGVLSMPTQASAENLEETLARLDDMIGLASIKQRVREYTSYLNFLKLRKEKGIDDNQPISLHSVFIGNPGTGKTTIAKMLGQIYKNMGLLNRGHVHEVDRADLVGEYIGQTAPKVKKAIKQAQGGILFVDEAYALARKGDDGKDFGREVIEILLKELSGDESHTFALVVAGYPEEMEHFLNSNPGLSSRLSQRFHFPDYTPEELLKISDYAAEQRKVILSDEAKEYIYKKLVDAYRDRDRTFGNARFVNQLIDTGKMNMGLRLMKHEDPQGLTADELKTISLNDVELIFDTRASSAVDLPVDEALLAKSLEELHRMIGLEGVKRDIDELVKLVRFYRELGKNIQEEFNLHTVFVGNPGTGKTTVARILANIYKALGILERGHLVECDRAKLVAGFVGQTAQKTDQAIGEAKGGVLFVDEAYTLVLNDGDTYGKEAVATLLKRMEDKRGEFVVIAAGYPDDMKRFLETNPGLKSRFDRQMTFHDFSPEQLYQIALDQLAAEGITPDDDAAKHLQDYLRLLHGNRDKFFGNGRSVRKTIEQAVKNQHLRLANMPPNKRDEKAIATLTKADVERFDEDSAKENANIKRIGFQMNGGTESAPSN